MCSFKKTFITVVNFFLCCLALAGIGLLSYRSHEQGLLSAEALQQQKLNVPLAGGIVLIVVAVAAGLGLIGVAKEISSMLIVNSGILQLLLMAEVTLCGYYAGQQAGTNTFVSKLKEVLAVAQVEETFTVDLDLDSQSSTSLVAVVALQMALQELSIITTLVVACRMRYEDDGDFMNYANKSYRQVNVHTKKLRS